VRFYFLIIILVFYSLNAFSIHLDAVTGYGMDTKGGLDGRVIKVTNLKPSGKGSLRWAVTQKGPRLVVFEVAGVIDLEKSSISIVDPHLTIAGETAPDPGITIIRGGLVVRTSDVRITHLMVRPGDNREQKRSGWESDAIAVTGRNAYRVHIDHCSLTWAVDENASASGPRDKGHDATSKQVTFSNSIIAEALDYATHKKGKHSKGFIIHDYVRDVAVIGNLFAHNDRRNPYFKSHSNGVVINNFMYNLGNAAVQLGYVRDEYLGSGLKPGNPKVTVEGNVLIYGRDTYSDLPLVSYQGEAYLHDNQVLNLNNEAMPQIHGDIIQKSKRIEWPQGYKALASKDLGQAMLDTVGARPWSRDPIDKRIVDSVNSRTGRIIDSQESVGGYPSYEPSRRKLTVPATGRAAWLKSLQTSTSAAQKD